MIKKISKNKLLFGDSYQLIKQIEDKSIDLIVTDPPYLISYAGSSKGAISEKYENITKELIESKITTGIDLKILDEFMRVMKKPNNFQL